MELSQLEMSTMTEAEAEALISVVAKYLQDHGFVVGCTVILADGEGIKTLGNMPSESVETAMRIILDKIEQGEGPQKSVVVGRFPIFGKRRH